MFMQAAPKRALENACMLKITTDGSARARLLRLEGRLVGPWVAELEIAVDSVRRASPQVNLDFAAVNFVDEEGLALLHRMREQGVRYQHLSPFIRDLLERR